MKKVFSLKLPDKRKVPLHFTVIGLMLVLCSSAILLLSITTSTLVGADRYIFLTSLSEAVEYLLLSLLMVVGGGFFLDYFFCKSNEI